MLWEREGGRACLLSPDAASCSRYLASSSLHCERPSAHSYSPSFLSGVLGLDRPPSHSPARGTVAWGSGTVVGRRGPLRAQTSETRAGGVTAGRTGARMEDVGRRASSGAGKANFLISSAGNGERTRIEWGARNGVSGIRHGIKFKKLLIVQNGRDSCLFSPRVASP